MSIQSNINQGISLLGLLFSQTPAAAVRREQAVDEYKEASKQMDKLEKIEEDPGQVMEPETHVLDTIEEQKKKGYPLSQEQEVGLVKASFGLAHERNKQYVDAAKTKMELNPSEQTQKDYLMATQHMYAAQEEEKSMLSHLSNKRAQAEAKAIEESKAEQERIARSREITKMITEGIPLSRESQAYVNKRLGGNQ